MDGPFARLSRCIPFAAVLAQPERADSLYPHYCTISTTMTRHSVRTYRKRRIMTFAEHSFQPLKVQESIAWQRAN